MALTRKSLAAMDIPAEKIEEIISAHVETVNAIKEERDALKADVGRLPDVEKQLADANAALDKFKAGDWEKKYNDLKSEYTTFKTDTETKAIKAAKEKAYTQLLKDAGISDKRIGTILKVSDVDGVELDKDGKVKDADKLTEHVKEEWSDFIVTEGKQGTETPAPANNNGGDIKQTNRVAEMVAQYRNEHYGNPVKED
jgi:hypothetical protein